VLDYLPFDDIGQYSLLVVADALILMFWWFIMSRLGDV
jgi:hypothetical protein